LSFSLPFFFCTITVRVRIRVRVRIVRVRVRVRVRIVFSIVVCAGCTKMKNGWVGEGEGGF
jgi:hypothetical protein